MNFNKDLYDKTEAKELGEFERLELGGHEIVILDAREYTSELSGNTSLKICVDIAGNDKQKDYFKKQYNENNNKDKKWPTGATRFLSLKDENIAYLKGFITSLEKSNPKFKFDINGKWDQLKNLKCAGQFGLEEFKDQEGKIKTTTKLIQFRSLDKLNEITVPKVKLIDGTLVDYDSYNENCNDDVVKKAQAVFGSDIVEISDSVLPF